MDLHLDSLPKSLFNWRRVNSGHKLHLLSVVCCLFAHATAYSQEATLALSSGVGTPGEMVSLDVSLDADETVRAAGLQWTFRYSPGDFSAASVAAGPAVTSAQKTLSCAGEEGRTACLVTGTSRMTLSAGRIATVTLTISNAPRNNVSRVELTDAVGTTQVGSKIPISTTGGLVTIPQGEGANIPEPLEADQPRRARPGTRVLRPGSPARRSPPSPEPSKPAGRQAAGQPAEVPANRAQPVSQQAKEGTIFWMGKLNKNEVVVIEDGEANWGYAEGQFLPGSPVEVKVFSPAVSISEQPNPKNEWKRVAFRCLKSTAGSVTINIEWRLLP